MNSRQQNFNSAPSNNLEDEEPVQQKEEVGDRPNEPNEPKKPKETGEIPRMQGATVQNSAGKATSAGSRKQDPERQGSVFPPGNGR